jgi:hypothetical protein
MEISSVPQSAFDRALELQRQLDETLAGRVALTPWGAALYHDGYPRVTDLNVLLVYRNAESLDAPALIEEAEQLQANLSHRAIRPRLDREPDGADGAAPPPGPPDRHLGGDRGGPRSRAHRP